MLARLTKVHRVTDRYTRILVAIVQQDCFKTPFRQVNEKAPLCGVVRVAESAEQAVDILQKHSCSATSK